MGGCGSSMHHEGFNPYEEQDLSYEVDLAEAWDFYGQTDDPDLRSVFQRIAPDPQPDDKKKKGRKKMRKYERVRALVDFWLARTRFEARPYSANETAKIYRHAVFWTRVLTILLVALLFVGLYKVNI